MKSEKLVCLMEENNGQLPKYTELGGYPLHYFDNQGNVLCAHCATLDMQEDDSSLVDVGINYENAFMYCDQSGVAGCQGRIESAYAEEEILEDEDYTPLCDECDALIINGILAHEHGCPSARRERFVEEFDEMFPELVDDGWNEEMTEALRLDAIKLEQLQQEAVDMRPVGTYCQWCDSSIDMQRGWILVDGFIFDSLQCVDAYDTYHNNEHRSAITERD